MKAVAYGSDGFSGDSAFIPGEHVLDASGGSSYEELLRAWTDSVLTGDLGFCRDGDGWSGEDDDGEIWTLSFEEALDHLERDLEYERPAGFWILEEGDLEQILAGTEVEAVYRAAKQMCAQFAAATVGTAPAD